MHGIMIQGFNALTSLLKTHDFLNLLSTLKYDLQGQYESPTGMLIGDHSAWGDSLQNHNYQ